MTTAGPGRPLETDVVADPVLAEIVRRLVDALHPDQFESRSRAASSLPATVLREGKLVYAA